ncbi:cobalt-precorrin 5A hydrolase/precorrin-3B C17-methyltransferase [Oceanicella actignis]|nr:cobalt-precorrin 5A hydrolase/precorrin-3B C17-methyltransferase [Oceanicella actignis]
MADLTAAGPDFRPDSRPEIRPRAYAPGAVPAVLCLTASGLETARRAARALGADLHGRAGRVDEGAPFEDAAAHLRALFAAGRPIVAVCAAGIVIRALAPLLGDKRAEPPVVALAEDGSAAVPLLGGHRGANRMARALAAALGGAAALTTAGDLALGVALDEPPEGWALENPEDAKALAAALLSGAAPAMTGEAPWLAEALARAGRPPASGAAGAAPEAPASAAPAPTATLAAGGAGPLRYWRRDVALGLGCARGCDPAEMADLARRTLREAGLSPLQVAFAGSLDLKADEPAVIETARALGAPLRLFTAEQLEAEAPRLANPSPTVLAEVGCHGVAEGAALALAGPEGALIAPKRKSANATCAAARIGPGAAPWAAGRARGRVALVGIGPGQADWRTPEASRLIAEADELVGYSLYLDLLGPLAAGKPRADFPLGAEEDRCRYALERAGRGRNVAIVCSGDAGIYAMGALVFELMDRAPDKGGVGDAARRVEVISAPGVSALQAAAARAGAPLGHDFCAISLSDLLTPRETILQRIRAAAEGDFVIAFYNPVSRRRRDLLAIARDMLLERRPPDTPVLLASSLGRPEERIAYRRLDALRVEEVDMLTVVLVGSSQSRLAMLGEGPRMYTPRGYARRIDARAGAGREEGSAA